MVTQNSLNNSSSPFDVDNIHLAGNTISTTDTNGDLDLSPDGTGGVSLDRLKANYSGATSQWTINAVTTDANVISSDTGGSTVIQYIVDSIQNTAGVAGRIIGTRARDAGGLTPDRVNSGDLLLDIYGTGFDTVDYATAARIAMFVDAPPGAGDMPGRIVFYTSQNGTESLSEAMKIDSTQTIFFTTYTQNALTYIGASGEVTELGPLTDGQLVVGSTGNAPVAATLTAGTNISISNGAGSVTINAGATSQVVNVTPLTDLDSTYVVLSTDYYLSCDVSSGVLQINFPNAPTTGRIFVIKDATGSAATNNITLTTVGGAVNIDGATSYVMNTDYQAVNLLFNGTSYEVY